MDPAKEYVRCLRLHSINADSLDKCRSSSLAMTCPHKFGLNLTISNDCKQHLESINTSSIVAQNNEHKSNSTLHQDGRLIHGNKTNSNNGIGHLAHFRRADTLERTTGHRISVNDRFRNYGQCRSGLESKSKSCVEKFSSVCEL